MLSSSVIFGFRVPGPCPRKKLSTLPKVWFKNLSTTIIFLCTSYFQGPQTVAGDWLSDLLAGVNQMNQNLQANIQNLNKQIQQDVGAQVARVHEDVNARVARIHEDVNNQLARANATVEDALKNADKGLLYFLTISSYRAAQIYIVNFNKFMYKKIRI